MKKSAFIVLILCLIASTACKNEVKTDQNTEPGKISVTGKPIETESGTFTIDLKTNPTEVKAGENTELSLEIKNPQGEIFKDLAIVHEKPMHLLIVSKDLEEFYHLHPEVQPDGRLKTSFNFPNGGDYEIYADFTMKDLPPTAQNFSLKVSGKERAATGLKPDEKFEKIVEGLRFVMKPSGELVSDSEIMLNYQVFDAANKPVTDLENYLGEKAHFVIVSKDLKEFVHAHPMSDENAKPEAHSHTDETHHAENKANPATASTISAHVGFPKASLYKIWAQFQRGGKIITVPFVVDVKAGSKEKETAKTDVEIPENAVKIVVSKNGFTPSEVSFKKDQPLKLAFYRADKENCADEVVFKDLNITKKLPVGETTIVEIPTEKSGEFDFACGMNMFRGKLLIQ